MENATTLPDSDLDARSKVTRDRDVRRASLREKIKRERRILIPILVLVVLAWPNFGMARVVGHSMEPTFHTGDSLVLLKSYRYFSPLKPGDIVVIHLRHGSIAGEEIVKRVVYVQNKTGNAPWPTDIHTIRGNIPARHFFDGPVSGMDPVPPGDIEVMGDNFMNSMDSRDFGPVLPSEIYGKVLNP